jgi:regulation of enolase protein 1 (concanavalin A-like superfamily)
MDLRNFSWINAPGRSEVNGDRIVIYTDPHTDYWQNTYYDFRHDNAHAFVLEAEGDFTFEARAGFEYGSLFDQCGLLLYQNHGNWAKASLEYADEQRGWLGSVVTNLGYSDWATSDVDGGIREMIYRLSRRGSDFLFECSRDGHAYHQMRIFHMHEPIGKARFGVYACSPGAATFRAEFSGLRLGPCAWEAHV